MAYIKEGDLLVSKAYGTKYIATSSDYVKRVPGSGEYVDDWSFVPAVNTINPETGHQGYMFLRDIKKVND